MQTNRCKAFLSDMNTLRLCLRQRFAKSQGHLSCLLRREASSFRGPVTNGVRYSNVSTSIKMPPLEALVGFSGIFQPPYRMATIKYQGQFYSTERSKDDCLVEELKGRLDANNVYLVDVRRPDELKEAGHIAGSVNIPLDQLEAALQLTDDTFEQQFGRSKPCEDGSDLVFHCRSGVRSLTAIEIGRKLGFVRCRHLPGGFLQWKETYGN